MLRIAEPEIVACINIRPTVFEHGVTGLGSVLSRLFVLMWYEILEYAVGIRIIVCATGISISRGEKGKWGSIMDGLVDALYMPRSARREGYEYEYKSFCNFVPSVVPRLT